IYRHVSQAPVIDANTQSDKGLGLGIRFHTLLTPITGNGLSVYGALGVLTADDIPSDLLLGHPAKRFHNLDLLITDTVWAKVSRWFHGDQAKKLEQMVLDHVAQRTRAFIIAGASLDAECF